MYSAVEDLIVLRHVPVICSKPVHLVYLSVYTYRVLNVVIYDNRICVTSNKFVLPNCIVLSSFTERTVM